MLGKGIYGTRGTMQEGSPLLESNIGKCRYINEEMRPEGMQKRTKKV